MYEGKCTNCNKEYERKTKPKEQNFCSVSCQNKWQYENGVRDAQKITEKAHQTLRDKGHYKRDNTYLQGENNPAWKGGRNITQKGYVRIRKFGGYVLEHRYVWEQANGEIPPGYQIHHINHNKQDNRLENLQLLSNSEHQKLHNQPKDKRGRFVSETDEGSKTS